MLKLQRDSLIDSPEAAEERRRLAFNLVIQRYISMAHGLPPPPDRCPYLSQNCNKTKGKLAHQIYPRKNHTSTGSTTNTSTMSLSSSAGHLSSFTPHAPPTFYEEDFVQEVEDFLKKRKKQLGLDDDYVLKEVEESDEDDFHYHHSGMHSTRSVLSGSQRKQGEICQGDLPSRVLRNRERKRKEHGSLGEDVNSNKVRSLDDSKPPNKKSRNTLKDLTNTDSGEQRSYCENKSCSKRSRTSEEKIPDRQVNPTQDKIAELRQSFVQYGSSNDRKLPRKDRPPKIKSVKNSENHIKDKNADLRISSGQQDEEVQHRSSDDKKLPRKRGMPPKLKRVENPENDIEDKNAKLRISSGQQSGEVEAENKTKERETGHAKKCTEGKEHTQILPEISDRIEKLVQDALGRSATVLYMVQKGEVDVHCLLDSLDAVHIVVTQDEASTYKGEVASKNPVVGTKDQTSNKEENTETKRSVKMHSKREMETRMEKVQLSSTHTSKIREIDVQQQKEQGSTRKYTMKGETTDPLKEQTAKTTKPLPRQSASKTSAEIVEKRKTRRNTKIKFSALQEVTKPVLEESALKKAGQIHSQGSEHVSKELRSSRKQSIGSSMSTKTPAKTSLSLSLPQQNHSDLVLSRDVTPSKKLCEDPSRETQQQVSCEPVQCEHESSSSPTGSLTKMPNSEICSVNLLGSTKELAYQSMEGCSERKRLIVFDRSESEDENDWITTSSEEDTVQKLNTSSKRKKRSFLYQLPGLQKKSKHRKSFNKVAYGEEDDIIIMEAPKTTSDNKVNYSDGESIKTLKEVQNKSTMSPSPVSLKRQPQGTGDWTEKNKRAADGHQRSLNTSMFYISRLISNSMAKNSQVMMTTFSTAKAAVQDEREDLDPEDTLALLQVPPLQQSYSTILASKATRPSSQEPKLMKTGSTSPSHWLTADAAVTTSASNIATTTAIASISATNATASKSMRRFLEMDNDEEAEDRASLVMEPLFKSTSALSVKSALEMNTELPHYSTLGPERWMAAMRALQKKKKNSYLRFPLL